MHQSQEVWTSGIFTVEQKLLDERKYYLIIDEKKVKVSYNEFQLVKENQKHFITFVWNKRSPNKGVLKKIEPIE